MLVFLSCSGDRSKAVGAAFSTWIRQVIQAVDPWISADIEKGARWTAEVSAKLEESRVGIICLTKENLKAEWILFETGAIAKTKDARPCTLLLDVAPADVEQPLGMFQHTTARDKNDVRKLLQTINTAVEKCGERWLSESVLNNAFEMYWPGFSEELEKIASQQPPSDPVKRTEPEILQEILEILRGQERRGAEAEIEKARREVDRHVTTFEMMRRHLEPNVATKIAKDNIARGAIDDVLVTEVARYLRDNKGGGALTGDFVRYLAAREAEDEKKRKASPGEGEKDET